MTRGHRARMRGLLLILICAVALVVACKITMVCVRPLVTGSTAEHIEQLRAQVAPLDFDAPFRSESLDEYLRFYGLNTNGIRYVIGTFVSGTNTIVAQFFMPPERRGTVLVMHGCYDHSGSWKHVIRELTGAGYGVAIYDAPGHGLSTGERADIDGFSDYRDVFEDFLAICRARTPGPHHLVGHSMGGAAALDYLLTSDDEAAVSNVVLLAPLVRSDMWDLSRAGHSVAGTVIESVPRAFRENSSDEEYMEFVKNDPLQCRVVPMTWVSAMYEWNDRLEGYAAASKPVTIIQGTADTTVDWEYNIPFLEGKLTSAEVIMITNAGHQLMNESPEMRNKVLKALREALADRHSSSPDVAQ